MNDDFLFHDYMHYKDLDVNKLTGDQFAKIRICLPVELTDEEKELFERLAEVSTFDPRKED